jgi:hypothetical protein
MLNPISDTTPVRGAIDQASDMLTKALSLPSSLSVAKSAAAE